MFNRRQVLAAAAAAIAALTGWRIVGGSAEDAVVAVLRKRLDYLWLDESGLRAFATDLAARAVVSRSKLRWLDVAGPIYAQLDVPLHRNALTSALRRGEERVVSLYLLSSDFFVNGADATRLVRYCGFYDPLLQPRPCGNPFSRPLST